LTRGKVKRYKTSTWAHPADLGNHQEQAENGESHHRKKERAQWWRKQACMKPSAKGRVRNKSPARSPENVRKRWEQTGHTTQMNHRSTAKSESNPGRSSHAKPVAPLWATARCSPSGGRIFTGKGRKETSPGEQALLSQRISNRGRKL